MELREFSPEAVRDAFVLRFGARCAGWLAWKFHRQLRKIGRFVVDFGQGQEEPPWFQIAVEFMRRRPSKWDVEVTRMHGKKFFQVRWIGTCAWRPRPIPTSLRVVK